MKKYSELNENEKREVKRNLLIGAGGVGLLIGGIFIGRKIWMKHWACKIAHCLELEDQIESESIISTMCIPGRVAENAKEIDMEIFTDIAAQIENSVIALDAKDLHLDRSWEVGEGIVKNLKVTVDTIKG